MLVRAVVAAREASNFIHSIRRPLRVTEVCSHDANVTMATEVARRVVSSPDRAGTRLLDERQDKGSGIVQTECRSLIIHHNVLSPVCTKLRLGGAVPPPDPPPPWWIVDPCFLKPKPKTPSLKPKEKANLFEKKQFFLRKKEKKTMY